jgi:Fe-S oxidoreductase
MAMEARSRYVEKFGVNLEKKLLVSAEITGRTTRKISKLIGLPMKFKSVRKLGEIITGISAEREFLAFSSKSLYERINQTEGEGEKTLMYFAGCYASYIKPEIGVATIKVLKNLGYKIITPEQHCCGLPMMTKGMVKQAKNKVRQNLNSWGKYIDEVEYIVVSCSSCGLALLKEWKYLLSNEEIDEIANKMIHISQLVNEHDISLKHSELNLAYHMPCHLKVQKAADSSIKMLNSVEGIKLEDLKSHCCGMAGSWGISKNNYDLSVEIGSSMIRKLNMSNATIGVTDCPTCRMQMEHLSEKEIKHPIEVIAECMEND